MNRRADQDEIDASLGEWNFFCTSFEETNARKIGSEIRTRGRDHRGVRIDGETFGSPSELEKGARGLTGATTEVEKKWIFSKDGGEPAEHPARIKRPEISITIGLEFRSVK